MAVHGVGVGGGGPHHDVAAAGGSQGAQHGAGAGGAAHTTAPQGQPQGQSHGTTPVQGTNTHGGGTGAPPKGQHVNTHM